MQDYLFSISLKSKIDQFDNKTLVYLYLPIIGSRAYSLYNLLVQESKSCKKIQNYEFRISRLISILGINFDSFQNQISRLEAMKLIETLINNKKGSIAFKIYAPLEPSLFFESDIFRALLAKKVQKEQYESIKFIFKDETIDYSEYENISASINNVFKEELESIQESDSVALKMIKYNSNPILDKINYQYILEILNKNDIPLNIKTSKYKEIINAIAINYGFSNEEIAEIFIKTVKKFGIKFDKKALDSIISDMYSDILQKQPTVTLDEPINAKLDSKTKKLFELKNIDSETYICSILKEKIISPISKDIIYTLRDTYKLSDPVINTLLDYAHFKSDGKIVPAYVNKIASTLFEMDIHNSLEKSMEHLKAAHKSKKSSKNFSSKNFLNKQSNQKHQIDWEEIANNREEKVSNLFFDNLEQMKKELENGENE